jgi:ParB-like chromosome segregation protein Spo0J
MEAVDVGGGQTVIVDDRHRAEAAIKAGIPKVPVNVATVST